ncbi:electron transport complex protein RnfA [Hydrogenoanaerobacterium saccharovorans]|uniref:Ion-translocating oxidoreductase complex subunit A n=1 Tax=Hydrogenoanaerobacterium saccharovorans TaxID=474960 RepID=A0A1H7YXL0_9FIRM|nr:RnfABCDGE type electron transport complex subunit A [Hydrogenoanaerobacterium saccharovorans]RPF48960.1 electron transport complex protein RnfA [Hydrogenoanaerobacterium saccharovorans]SEM50544.1 electron transport complex protein RnfA [Hydrogenoanaerobacterium saccharovorans]
MELAKSLSIVLFSAILVNNFVLSKFMGICPFLGVSKNLKSAFGMSCAVTFVMLMATAVTHPLYTYLLVPNGLEYLDTVSFILVIAAFVQLVEIVLKRYIPALHKTLGVYLPLITTNCAILGVTLLNIKEGYSYGVSLVNALGGGLGFMLAMVLFAGVRTRLEDSRILRPFEGLPITLISASIVALSFLGFGGVIDGIFK